MQELWKPVDFGTNYQVSSYGRVYNIKTGKFLSGTFTEEGYPRFCLSGEDGEHWNVTGHVLVMRAFAGPCPPGQQVRHLDGNPANNYWAPGNEEETKALGGNLIYGTPKENIEDRDQRHGRNGHANKTNCGTCGLPYDEANTYVYPEGSHNAGARGCRNCIRASGRRHDAEHREERARRKRERRAAQRAARPERLTTAGAAALLGVSTETVRRWCNEGLLPFEQPGQHKRFRREDVMKLARQPSGTGSTAA
jgi:excisionase family DNA binding protein